MYIVRIVRTLLTDCILVTSHQSAHLTDSRRVTQYRHYRISCKLDRPNDSFVRLTTCHLSCQDRTWRQSAIRQ